MQKEAPFYHDRRIQGAITFLLFTLASSLSACGSTDSPALAQPAPTPAPIVRDGSREYLQNRATAEAITATALSALQAAWMTPQPARNLASQQQFDVRKTDIAVQLVDNATARASTNNMLTALPVQR